MFAPKTRFAPTLIAPDTYVIHDHEGEGTDPVAVPLNTMVIRGASRSSSTPAWPRTASST